MANYLKELYPDGFCLLTNRLPRKDSSVALLALRPFQKFRSAAVFQSLGLRFADILIIHELCPNAKRAVEEFVINLNLDRLLIRTDMPGNKFGLPSYQGIPASDAWGIISNIFDQYERIVVAVQAAGNIFRNSYNINFGITHNERLRCCFEIVGPGFTASDLNRHGVFHERIEVPSFTIELYESLICRTFTVTRSQYQVDRRNKISKYGFSTLKHENAVVLEKKIYEPIPLALLQDVWNYWDAIEQAIGMMGYGETGGIVSLSYLNVNSQPLKKSFWDIHRFA